MDFDDLDFLNDAVEEGGRLSRFPMEGQLEHILDRGLPIFGHEVGGKRFDREVEFAGDLQ